MNLSLYGIYFLNNNLSNSIYGKFNDATQNSLTYKMENTDSSVIIRTSQKCRIGSTTQNNHSILFGEIFAKPGDLLHTITIKSKTIEQLNRMYWGSYLFILLGKNGFECFVSKSSSIQLFYYHAKDYVIFATDIMFMSQFITLEFDENYLEMFLLYGDFLSFYTPFKDIQEICGGYGLQVDFHGNSKTTQFWRPIEFDNCDYEASRQSGILPETLSHVLHVATHGYKDIFLDLSGGLDSSSILFALNNQKEINKTIYGLTIVDKSVRSSNELQHVNKLKNSLDFVPIELDYNSFLPFSECNEIKFSHLPSKPTILMSHLKKDYMLNKLVESYSNNAIHLNGHVGDSLFLCPPPIEAISDLVFHGKYGLIKAKIMEIAIYYRKPIPEILFANIKQIIKHIFRIPPNFLYHGYAPWYKIKFKHDKKYFTLYDDLAFSSTPSLPLHLSILSFTLASTQVNLRHNPIFYPFASQPMLESGLKINSYDSFSNGYDRYLFRQSISRYFNTDLVWRKDKGETTGVFYKGLNANKDYILQLVMEGYCVRKGIIDKKILQYYCNRISSGLPSSQWAFTHLLCLEIFVDLWKARL